jgi:hypothetical protein
MLSIMTGSTGLSEKSTSVLAIFFTTSKPSVNSPKIVWFPLSQGAETSVIKN